MSNIIKYGKFYYFFSIYSTIINLLMSVSTLKILTEYIGNFSPTSTFELITVVLIVIIFIIFFSSFTTGVALAWKRKIKAKILKAILTIQIALWNISNIISIILTIIGFGDYKSGIDWASLSLFVAGVGIAWFIISITNTVINSFAMRHFAKIRYTNII